jgi:hypothetical protein
MHKVCICDDLNFHGGKLIKMKVQIPHKEKKNLMAMKTQNLEMNLHIFLISSPSFIELSYDAYAFLQTYTFLNIVDFIVPI